MERMSKKHFKDFLTFRDYIVLLFSAKVVSLIGESVRIKASADTREKSCIKFSMFGAWFHKLQTWKNIRKQPDLFAICEKNSVTQFSKVFNISSDEKKIAEIQLFLETVTNLAVLKLS